MSKSKTAASESNTSSGDQSDGMELFMEIVPVLLRRKGTILAAAVLGVLLGLAYLLITPPNYESRAQILVMQNESAMMATERRASGSGGVSEDLLSTHMSLLQSQRVVMHALSNAGLESLPSITGKLDSGVSPSDYVIENLYVTRGGDGGAKDARVLTVAFRHSDPSDTQKVVQAILDEYKAFVAAKFQDVNEEAVELINRARLELEKDIQEMTSEYREFRNSSPLLAASEGGANIYAMLYEELSSDLSRLTITIDESRGRLELVQEQMVRLENSEAHPLEKLALIDTQNAERLGILVTVERGESQTAAFQALQPERMARASAEYNVLNSLKGELSQAMLDYGPKHPAVKTLQTQIEKIEEFVQERQPLLTVAEDELKLTPDDVMGAYMRLLENDLLALEKRRGDLTSQIAEAETKAKALVDYELEDEQRVRELQRTEELYDSIVGRLRDINMQQGSNALIQEIIENPEEGTKVSPKPLIAAVIFMLTTMLLAGGAVIVSELTDKRIHSARELEDIYQAKIVSHIPDLQQDDETRAAMKKIGISKSGVSPYVLAFHEPRSKISEAIRTIRTQLFLDLKQGDKLIAVTSPSQGDGKSTISANLAASVAQTGKRVLLIDADMRRPAVHALFGLPNDTGLSTVLAEEAEFHDVIQQGPPESLFVLTAGPVAKNPAELLCSSEFKGLLETLREKFDVIILDCPPVLPVTDPTIIGPLSDYVMLVTTNLDEKGLPKARQCHRSLDSCGISLGAIIVNRTHRTNADYAYGDYQTDYSEYESYREKVGS